MSSSNTHSVSVLCLLPLRLSVGLSFIVGVSVFLGLFTRFGTAVGLFMILNYTFAVGLGIWIPNLETLFFWAMLTLFLSSAGRGMGADQVLRSRKRIRLFT